MSVFEKKKTGVFKKEDRYHWKRW